LAAEVFDDEPGTSGITEHEKLDLIEDQSRLDAIKDTVSLQNLKLGTSSPM